MNPLSVTRTIKPAMAVALLAVASLASAQEGPQVTLSPTSLSFGQVTMGDEPALETLALNTGDANLTFTNTSTTGAFLANGFNSECLQSFPPEGGCYFTVLFDPTAPGLYSGTLSIFDNAPNSPQAVPLSGKATALKISPNPILFGTYTPGETSPSRTVTIKNVWTTPVTISNISFSGANAGDFIIGNQTCLTALASKASCSFDVSFAPSVVSSETAILIITDDEPGGPDTVTAHGDGTYLLVTPRLETFSKANPAKLKLTNTGASTIGISSIKITGPNAGYFIIDGTTCGDTLSPGAICTVSVQEFGVSGFSLYAALTITDDEGGSPQQAFLFGVNPDAMGSIRSRSALKQSLRH